MLEVAQVAQVSWTSLERLALSHGPSLPIDGASAPVAPTSGVVARVGTSDATGAQVVQFVDRRTGALVAQLPPEAVLRIVELLVDSARRS